MPARSHLARELTQMVRSSGVDLFTDRGRAMTALIAALDQYLCRVRHIQAGRTRITDYGIVLTLA